MRKINFLLVLVISLLFSCNKSDSEDEPTPSSTKVTFTKAVGSDWTLAQNQDRITDKVWITRGTKGGIFNAAVESGPNTADYDSPKGTEWAYGTTANIGSLEFDTWDDTHGAEPPTMVDRDMVVHLIEEDIYLDIKFTSWSTGDGSGGGSGGGFSYIRSSVK